MKATKWIRYTLAALLTPAIVGGLRARSFLAREEAPLVAASFFAAPTPEPHDWTKPTVAVVLGADVTEITDMVGPYEMFARTGLYNVYAVAPTAASTTLTGGLRVRPHYSFEDLDRLLDGAPPAIVVAPNVPNIKSPETAPWLSGCGAVPTPVPLRCRGAPVQQCWPKQDSLTVVRQRRTGVTSTGLRKSTPGSSGNAACAGSTTAAS